MPYNEDESGEQLATQIRYKRGQNTARNAPNTQPLFFEPPGAGAAIGQQAQSFAPTRSTIYYTGPTGSKELVYTDKETGEKYTDKVGPFGPPESHLPDYIPGIAYGYQNLPKHGRGTLGGYYLVTPKEGPNAGETFILPHSDIGPGGPKGKPEIGAQTLDYNAPAAKMVFGSMREAAVTGGANITYIGKELPENIDIGKQNAADVLARKYNISPEHEAAIKATADKGPPPDVVANTYRSNYGEGAPDKNDQPLTSVANEKEAEEERQWDKIRADREEFEARKAATPIPVGTFAQRARIDRAGSNRYFPGPTYSEFENVPGKDVWSGEGTLPAPGAIDESIRGNKSPEEIQKSEEYYSGPWLQNPREGFGQPNFNPQTGEPLPYEKLLKQEVNYQNPQAPQAMLFAGGQQETSEAHGDQQNPQANFNERFAFDGEREQTNEVPVPGTYAATSVSPSTGAELADDIKAERANPKPMTPAEEADWHRKADLTATAAGPAALGAVNDPTGTDMDWARRLLEVRMGVTPLRTIKDLGGRLIESALTKKPPTFTVRDTGAFPSDIRDTYTRIQEATESLHPDDATNSRYSFETDGTWSEKPSGGLYPEGVPDQPATFDERFGPSRDGFDKRFGSWDNSGRGTMRAMVDDDIIEDDEDEDEDEDNEEEDDEEHP